MASALPPAASISAAAVWIVPGSLGCGSVGLGGDDDVGAVARGAQRDRQADAAGGAGDEERLAGEGGHESSGLRSVRDGCSCDVVAEASPGAFR